MKTNYSLTGVVRRFFGLGGWMYVVVPKRYTKELKAHRRTWGKYPITARVGKTEWKTKLMIKKGGDFFVALKAEIRRREGIKFGDKVRVSFCLE